VCAIRSPVSEYESAAQRPLWDIVSFAIGKKLEPKLDESGGPARWGGTKWNVIWQTFRLPGFACTMESRLPETISGEDFTRIYPIQFLILSPPSAPK